MDGFRHLTPGLMAILPIVERLPGLGGNGLDGLADTGILGGRDSIPQIVALTVLRDLHLIGGTVGAHIGELAGIGHGRFRLLDHRQDVLVGRGVALAKLRDTAEGLVLPIREKAQHRMIGPEVFVIIGRIAFGALNQRGIDIQDEGITVTGLGIPLDQRRVDLLEPCWSLLRPHPF